MRILALTGPCGGSLDSLCDVVIKAPGPAPPIFGKGICRSTTPCAPCSKRSSSERSGMKSKDDLLHHLSVCTSCTILCNSNTHICPMAAVPLYLQERPRLIVPSSISAWSRHRFRSKTHPFVYGFARKKITPTLSKKENPPERKKRRILAMIRLGVNSVLFKAFPFAEVARAIRLSGCDGVRRPYSRMNLFHLEFPLSRSFYGRKLCRNMADYRRRRSKRFQKANNRRFPSSGTGSQSSSKPAISSNRVKKRLMMEWENPRMPKSLRILRADLRILRPMRHRSMAKR